MYVPTLTSESHFETAHTTAGAKEKKIEIYRHWMEEAPECNP